MASRFIHVSCRALVADNHQRVISSKGLISPRGDGGLGVDRQREALQAEGVEVIVLPGGAGSKIDLRVYGWFPESVDLG